MQPRDKQAVVGAVVGRVDPVVVQTGKGVERWKEGKRRCQLDYYLDCSVAAVVLVEAGQGLFVAL